MVVQGNPVAADLGQDVVALGNLDEAGLEYVDLEPDVDLGDADAPGESAAVHAAVVVVAPGNVVADVVLAVSFVPLPSLSALPEPANM